MEDSVQLQSLRLWRLAGPTRNSTNFGAEMNTYSSLDFAALEMRRPHDSKRSIYCSPTCVRIARPEAEDKSARIEEARRKRTVFYFTLFVYV
jgi:hypothetical protein